MFSANKEKWANLTDNEKKKYDDLAAKDIQRHDNQMAQLRKNGFFITEDGVKSTDLPPPKVKKIKRKPKRQTEQTEEQGQQ